MAYDFNWDDWDAQANEYLNSSDYFPTYTIPDYSIFNLDLTGGNDYTPVSDTQANVLGLKGLDAYGGGLTYLSPSTDATGLRYISSGGANDRIGLTLGDTGLGVDPYYSSNKLAVDANSDYGANEDYLSGDRVETTDWLGTTGNRNATTTDVLAASPEGRQLLLDAGLISPQEAIQYELQGNWEAGDMFLEDPEALNKYIKMYGQDYASSALGGLGNPINAIANTLASHQQSLKSALDAASGLSGVRNPASPNVPRAGGVTPNIPKGSNPLKGALNVASALAALKGLTQEQKAPAARGTAGAVNWGSGAQRVAPKFYAEGGKVGGLSNIVIALADAARSKGLIPGGEGGQDDNVDAKLSPGEYVFDAESVSALGDGNTEAGAKKLDEMRHNIRKHKRTGGLSSIPPKAKKTEAYLKG